jgi:hypothetical protein
MGKSLVQGDQSPHGRDGHAPFFCRAKFNSIRTPVSLVNLWGILLFENRLRSVFCAVILLAAQTASFLK